jgi:hypothetical protein
VSTAACRVHEAGTRTGLSFICAIVFTHLGELVSVDRLAEQKFHEIDVRANTRLGAEGSATAMAGGE